MNKSKILYITMAIIIAILLVWNTVLTINLVNVKGDFDKFVEQTETAHTANLSLWETQVEINQTTTTYFGWLGID